MSLNKRVYISKKTKVTAQNMNDIQDEIIRNGKSIDDLNDISKPKISTTIPDILAINTIYDLGTQTNLNITLPTDCSLGDFIQVDFISGSTPTTLTITSPAGLSQYDLVPESNKIYCLYLDWGILSDGVYGWRFGYAEYDQAIGE